MQIISALCWFKKAWGYLTHALSSVYHVESLQTAPNPIRTARTPKHLWMDLTDERQKRTGQEATLLDTPCRMENQKSGDGEWNNSEANSNTTDSILSLHTELNLKYNFYDCINVVLIECGPPLKDSAGEMAISGVFVLESSKCDRAHVSYLVLASSLPWNSPPLV